MIRTGLYLYFTADRVRTEPFLLSPLFFITNEGSNKTRLFITTRSKEIRAAHESMQLADIFYVIRVAFPKNSPYDKIDSNILFESLKKYLSARNASCRKAATPFLRREALCDDKINVFTGEGRGPLVADCHL